MSARDERGRLRKDLLHRRDQLSQQVVAEDSDRVCRLMLDWDQFRSARVVACYYPIRNEVDVRPVIDHCFGRGKRVGLPVVDKSRRIMCMREVDSFNDLVDGEYGIKEPDPSLAVIEPDQIDVCIVPGVCFDSQGNRLGYGAGYYDSFLPLMRAGAVRVAVAYEFQVVAHIVSRKGDEPVDVIITPWRVINCADGDGGER